MTDRELLELAAKAIGNDGDAFRLMVNMHLPLDIEDYATHVYPLGVHVDHEDKPEAATRWAIVIAAAEMGRRME